MPTRARIPKIAVDETRLAGFCVRHRVRALRAFGSILRDDFSADSDVDVLLEFEPGVDPDLLELGGMQQDLTDLFGREVDLKTPQMFSPPNLQRVLSQSLLAYAA